VSARLLIGGATSAIIVVCALVGFAHRAGGTPPTTLATFDPEDPERPSVSAQATANEVEPPAPDLAAQYPVPLEKGTPLPEIYPSLVDWIHPVTGAERLLPEFTTGGFGAERSGVTARHECGGGHCGVDLGGPRGRPIVAVADGVVVHIERSELGRDGRSGRYVRIEHDDGTLTAYMHLDSIIDGLQVGDHVDGGQQIGTLGATAVYSAAPHLHFSLELPNAPGMHGDNTNTHYVDPAPFLVRATVLDRAERHHPTKPAF
jgi:murein DD-endopeptidase MepM/ murein hydrolase activator NlpD